MTNKNIDVALIPEIVSTHMAIYRATETNSIELVETLERQLEDLINRIDPELMEKIK